MDTVTRQVVDLLDRDGPLTNATLHTKLAAVASPGVLDDVLDDLVRSGTVRVSYLQTNPPLKRYARANGFSESPRTP